MKIKLTLIALSFILSLNVFAQAPDLINYQAVARDAAGVPLINTAVNVQFEIRQSTPTGTVVYSETHSSTTNPFGLFTLQIGGGLPVSGTFAGINWSTGLYYLQVTVNGDAMAPSQLLSVPYALHANTATSGTPGANGHNGLSAITTEPAGANCPNGGYFVDVGVDDNDDGTLQALEIDFSYYVCNGLDGAANVNDTSATNELQNLSISNDTLFLSNGGFVVLPPALGDNWGTQVVITSGANLTGDGTIATPLMVIDNDTSATNELQGLSMTGNSINITNGTGAQLSAVAPTTGDYLYWNGVNWVAQAPAANTDNQNLINGGKSGNQQTINIQNGTGVNFSVADEDSLTTNEIQQLTFTSPTLGLSLGGGSVNLSGLNTDAQMLSYTAATQSLSISNGNTVTLDVNDADADPTNEYNTSFGINGTNLELVDGGNTFQVPLTTLSDGDWTVVAGTIYNTTENVGVGIIAPESKLHVVRTNASAATAFRLGNSNQPTREWNFDVDGTGDLILEGEGNGTPFTMLYFDEGNQFIGVGNNAPFSMLDVSGQITMRTGAVAGYVPVANAAGTMTWTDPTTISTADDGDWLRYNNGTFDYLINDNTHRVRVLDPSSTATNIQSNNATFEIYANGGDRAMQVNIRNVAIGDIDGGGAGANVFVDGDGSGDIQFNNFASTTMIVKSAGRVGVGTLNPASKLQVETTTDTRASQFIQSFSSTLDKYGLYALAQGVGTGENIGVQGEATGAVTNKGIVGRAFGGTNNWAGYFENGDVHVQNDLRIGATGAGTYNPKVLISTTTGDYTSLEADNQYSGSQTMYGYYNRMIATGTGGMAGIWNYMTPSASSSSPVYGFRSLILDGGNGARYGSYQYIHADGSGEVNGVYANINHDGTGNVYGLRADVSASSTSGTVRGLWVVGTIGTTNYIGGAGLGVGVQTPQNKLDVEGAAVIGATYAGTNTAPVNGLLVAGSVSIGSPTINSLYKSQITSSTHQYGLYSTISRPAGSNYGLRGTATSTSGSFNVGVYGSATGAASTNYGFFGAASGASGNNWAVYASGSAYSTGTWQTSDAKFKTNVKEVDNALDAVLSLRPTSYDFDTRNYSYMNLPEGKQYGFLAQELEEVIPEAVRDVSQDIGLVDKEREGETIEFKAVNYTQLIPLLTKAIQEQQKIIEELKKEVEALKNQQ